MVDLLRFVLCVYFIEQYASFGSEMDKLTGTEELHQLSAQLRSRMPKHLPASKPLNSEKLVSGSKCGVRPIDLESPKDFLQPGFFSRIIGGRTSRPGSQPWQVSIKLGRSHFCGGSLIYDNIVITAAHCVANLDENLVKNLIVTVGEYNLKRMDKGEQNIPVLKVIVHPSFNKFGYMDSDIALLYLKYRVKYGLEVQPICLPHKDDIFEDGMLCVVSGWGRVSEVGDLSNLLQEVELPILDSRSCRELLEALNLPQVGNSMLCAGFPDGGKDACKGDSGGPLACRKASGLWTLAGITSWGIGCAKGWRADKRRTRDRGSPGVFSKVAELLDFVAQNVIAGPGPSQLSHLGPEDCNSRGTLVFAESGHLQHPREMEEHYLDNSLCIWNITVPEDKIILIQFIQVDIEEQVGCDHDFLTFYSSEMELIGKVCGDLLPSPLLIESNQALVTFVSDGSKTGRGFEFTFSAVHKAAEAASGCGSVAVLVEGGKIDTANYPGLYPSNTKCHWLIEAPVEHIIKLEFEDFAIEIGQDCIYDFVAVYDDTEEEHQLALLCGLSIPSPVWSSGNTMLIRFESDGENSYRGFKARIAFFPSEKSQTELSWPGIMQASKPKNIPVDTCGSSPFDPQWLSRRIVGEEEACPHCWPWQVGLRFLGDHQCGGVVIRPTWVITAAHCLQPTKDASHWTVIGGDHDRILKEPTEQVRRVKAIIVHPDFDISSYDADIALVQLETLLSYNAAVRPICLPNNAEPLRPATLCTVTGWGNVQEAGGLSSRLQQTQVPILSNDVCQQNYYLNHPGGITARMLCAGFASSGGQDTCQGDSGSPLVCQIEDESFTLYGIVSWGVGCSRPKRPGVYTRVQVFLDWIMSRVQETGPVGVPVANAGPEMLVEPMGPLMKRTGTAYSPGCPSELILDKPRGIISSCCPLKDSGDAHCVWVLRISQRGMAKLTINHLSIHETENCKVEFFAIYEESYKGRKTLVKLCGLLQSPMILLSPGPTVKVELRSTIDGAFAMSYIVFGVQGPKKGNGVRYSKDLSAQWSSCQDVILTAQEGIIQSPGFFHGSSNTTSCHWRIVAPLNSIIRLDFLDFVIEKSLPECRDGLTVYEGFGSTEELLGNFCGEAPRYPLKSRGPVVTLIFHSSTETRMKGFVLAYSMCEVKPSPFLGKVGDTGKGCPILDLIPAGIVEKMSPNYPNTYPDLSICTWTVYSASGNRLKAVIQDLAMEDTKDCIWDSLTIYDGPDQHSELLGNLCGHKRDLRLVSSGSYMTVHFKADGSVGDRGFKMVFEEVDRGPVQCSRHGLELQTQRKCGVPLIDPFPMKEMSTKTATGALGEPRVVGGNPATPVSWPWLVSLQYENEHFCGGTLIDESWVLTAGHCNVSAQMDKVAVGITYLLPGAQGTTRTQVKVVHLHSNFSGFPFSNDLALLELEKPTQIGDTVAIICLPDQDEEIGPDAKCLTAGWGATEGGKDEFSIKLQQANMPLVSNEACARYWGEDIKNTNVCGGAAGSTPCAGDSGGPLICKIDERYKLIGVVSWGSDNCDPESPTVYTRISAYRDWISTITNGKL